jgi:hypothetical protein
MRTIRYFIQILELLRRRPLSRCPDGLTNADFHAKLEQQFILVQERQRQRAAGLWRATDDCPGPFRIQAGELSVDEIKHIYACHLCWLIYDLTRVDRSISALQRSARRKAKWLISDPAAPVAVGLLVIIGIFAVHLRLVGAGTRIVSPAPSQRLSSEPMLEPATKHAAPSNFKKERRKRLELNLRKLPPDVEMQIRLGPRLGSEFDSLRQVIALQVPANSDLGHRLDQSWLNTLRLAGNGLFIDIVRRQAAFAPKVQPLSLVKLAEIHANLAGRVSPKYFRELLYIQARLVSESISESRRMDNPKLIDERLLREAAEQLEGASPAAMGQTKALIAARNRRVSSSSLAKR